MKQKGILRLALLVTLLLALCTAVSAAGTVSVSVRGTAVQWADAVPLIQGGRTLVPLRAAAEAMGLTVNWDGASRSVTFTRDYTPESSPYQANNEDGSKEFILRRTVTVRVGQKTLKTDNLYAHYDGKKVTEGSTNGPEVEMDAAPILRENRAYAPLRCVAAAFNFDVLWDDSTRAVQLVDALVYNWWCGWTIADTAAQENPGSMILTIHTPNNIDRLQITSVSVAAMADDGTTPPISIRSADESDVRRVRAYVGNVTLLDTVRVEYPFKPAQRYLITYHMQITKSNGAVVADYGSFYADLGKQAAG